MDLIETSKIRYECLEGYHLRTISNINDLKNRKNLVEKCQADGIEEFVLIRRKNKLKSSQGIHNYDEYYDFDDYNADSLEDDYESYSDNLHSSILSNSNGKHLYECVKYCKSLKLNQITNNGYIVPQNTKVQFSPGEQIKYYCKEGFATDLTQTQDHINNMHTLECSINGTWNLVLKSNRFPSSLNKKDIQHLTECSSVDTLFDKNKKYNDYTAALSYSELNMRTFTMIFAICGLIILILLTSLLTLKLLKRKRNEIVFSNFSPQLDPLLSNNDNNSTLPEYSIRPRSIATIADHLNEMPTSASTNTFYLPSYQEAIQQPVFTPEQTNLAVVNKLDETAQISHLTSLQTQPSAPMRSRSGSVRSNITTRSNNGSIRTTNSIATTNSAGNASFNIPLPSYSNHSRSKTSNSIRSKQVRTSQLNNKRQASRTNRSTTSAISEACTLLTATNMSLMSNETCASVKALRGSSSGVDLSNNSGSNMSINNKNDAEPLATNQDGSFGRNNNSDNND